MEAFTGANNAAVDERGQRDLIEAHLCRRQTYKRNPSNNVPYCSKNPMVTSTTGPCSPSVIVIANCCLGNVISAYLYGALTVQLYRYYISFPKDSKLFKVVIYIVYVTETICTVLLIYQLTAMIAKANDLKVDGKSVICLYETSVPQTLAVCGGIVAFLAQSMYAYRIRIVTKLKYVPWVIILLMASQLFIIVTMSFRPAFVVMFMTIGASISMVVDVTITSIMVWFLKKDEIYSKQLKRKITRLIYIMIGTGFLTAATNLCLFVLSFYYFAHIYGLLIVLSKLYANSMMVLVNSRIPSARSELNHRATLDMITVRLSSIQFRVGSQAAADGEHGQISVDPEAPGVGLPAHEAEDTPNNDDLGSLAV